MKLFKISHIKNTTTKFQKYKDKYEIENNDRKDNKGIQKRGKWGNNCK